MSRFRRLTVALTTAAMLSGAGMACQRTQNTSEKPAEVTTTDGHKAQVDGQPAEIAWRGNANAKELSDQTRKGLAWVAAHQLDNGGWGQGDEAQTMGRGMSKMSGSANVADSSMSVLALMRAGNTAAKGEYAAAVKRGIGYIVSQIEESDNDSLYVTKVRGTRVQGKIGTYVDTFTALMVLTEAQGTMGSTEANQRLERAQSKVLAKIEKNQRADGTWANQGWAPALTQSIASKGLNRAAQGGAAVNEDTLDRVQAQAAKSFDGKKFKGKGTAGVALYGDASGSSTLRDSANTYRAKSKLLKDEAKNAPTQEARAKATLRIAAGERAIQVTKNAEQALIERLDDPAFIRGFGNNGGEEFLSYMLMSETLVADGGDKWKQWDERISKLLGGVQNDDGSWTGHHCITGRTFCTAAALLVLMADRAPVPIANSFNKQG